MAKSEIRSSNQIKNSNFDCSKRLADRPNTCSSFGFRDSNLFRISGFRR